MSMKYDELINLSDKELIEKYDKTAENTAVGLNYFTEELARRRAEKSNDIMIKLTKWITYMTAVMLLGTIVNVVIAFVK